MAHAARALLAFVLALVFVPFAEAGPIVYFDIDRSLNVNGRLYENNTTGLWGASDRNETPRGGLFSSQTSWIGRALVTPQGRQFESIEFNGIVRAWGDHPESMSTNFSTSFLLDVAHTADLSAGLSRLREGYAEGVFYNETTQTLLAHSVANGGLSYQGVLEPGIYSLSLLARIDTLGGPGVNDSYAQVAGSLALTPPAPVPEPATMTLLATGLLAAWRARRKSS